MTTDKILKPSISNLMNLRPEVSEDLVNEVKILSKNTMGSFEDSLRIVIEEFKKMRKTKGDNNR